MKLDDFDLRGMPQELIDFANAVTVILNFGKVQKAVVTGVPSWRGRRGEEAYLMSGTTGVLYVCTTDNATTWKPVATFVL